MDLSGNTLYFGSWTNDTAVPGVALTYTDATTVAPVTPSRLMLLATRPAHEWLWAHHSDDQSTNIPAMKLGANHVLTLYDTTGNPAIVLDPGNQEGANSVLTRQAADSLYVSGSSIAISQTTDWENNTSYSVAMPGGSATWFGSFAGVNSVAAYAQTTAIGNGAVAYGFASMALGYNASAGADYGYPSGTCSTAVGCGANAQGDDSTALGFGSTSNGWYTTAIGYCSTAHFPGSTAIGFRSYAYGDCSLSLGYRTDAHGPYQIAMGIYNIPHRGSYAWLPTDVLLVIGNGKPLDSNDNPPLDENWNPLPVEQSNALVMRKNGDTTLYGNLTVSGTASGMTVAGTPVETTLTSGETVTKIVSSGTVQSILVPESGDLSMGNFVNGPQPPIAGTDQPDPPE